jgi:hypothetical protein
MILMTSYSIHRMASTAYVGKPFTVPALQVIVEKDPIITPAWVAVHPTDSIVNLKQVWISEGGHSV